MNRMTERKIGSGEHANVLPDAISPGGRARNVRWGRAMVGILLAGQIAGQRTPLESTIALPSLSDIEGPLNRGLRHQIAQAIQAKDYPKAEQILVREIDRNPRSSELLKMIASVLFLDGKYLNVAIALKKAEKLSPLDDQSRFALAMAYVAMNHTAWAQPELDKLHGRDPDNALYLYWLGRLDYDAERLPEAVAKLEKTVELDPNFVKAHDNLGLCYEALGRFEDAVKSYARAVELNRTANPGSPWPPMNLGALLLKIERAEEAERYFQESLRINARFAPAHYELGIAFERKGQDADAIRQLEEAAALDTNYAQPHYALGRIYRKIGEKQKSKAELAVFESLKHARPQP
ncbi:MAG: tetratricopeptide repeat protein [Bryobacteraceae bacterium]